MSDYTRDINVIDSGDGVSSYRANRPFMSAICLGRVTKLRLPILCLAIILLSACDYRRRKNEYPLIEYAHLPIVGYNYTDERIGGYQINRSPGAEIESHRRATSIFCCMPVPRIYRPGMTAKIIKHIEDPSGPGKVVAIPPYTQEELGHVAVHFLADGDVRVFVTQYYETHQNYPFPEARVSVDGKYDTRSAWAWP